MPTDLIATTLASAAAPSGGGAFIVQILPLLLVFVIFYFLMIRPQQRRMKEHAATIAAVQKGARGYVVKPFTRDAILRTLAGVFQASSAALRAAPPTK